MVVGLLVHLPAARARYLLDDYIHAAMIRGTFLVPRGPFDLYDFVGEADRDVLSARGLLPWWSDPQLKIRFFRPLSSALMWSEHKLLGDEPLWLHLVSLVWWLAAVLAARSIFRRLLSVRAAFAATAIFALAPCHALPLAWLANREALVALTFGLFALGRLVGFYREGRAVDAALSVLGFTLSLLSGEYALGMGGYVLAFGLLLRAIPKRRRAVGLLLFAGPTLGYLALRARLGYGNVGSGVYTDPLAEPSAFLADAPRRLTTLLADVWLTLDGQTVTTNSSLWWFGPSFVVGAWLLLRSLRRALASGDQESRGALLAFFCGSPIALIPMLAVVPSPRVLGVALVGVSATVGALLDVAWWRGPSTRDRDKLGGYVALLLGFFHLVHGPVTAWLIGRNYRASSEVFERSAKELASRLGDTRGREVFVLRGMSGSFFLLFALDPTFTPPRRWRILAQTGHVLALRRGPRTLDLVGANRLFPSGPESPFRNDRTKFHTGDVIQLEGMRATVLDVVPEGPRAVRFETERDLDTYDWIAERKSGFVAVDVPTDGFGKPFDP